MEIEKIKHGSDTNDKPRFILNSVVNSDGVEEVQFVNPKKVLNKVLESAKDDEADEIRFVNPKKVLNKVFEAVKEDEAAKKAEVDKKLPKFIQGYEPQTELGKVIKNSFGNKYLSKHASSVYVLSGTDLTAFELVRKRILSQYSSSATEEAMSEYIDGINDIKKLSDSTLDTEDTTLGDGRLIGYDKVKTNSSGVRKYYGGGMLVKSVYPDGSVHFINTSYDVNEDSYSVTHYGSNYTNVDTYFSDGLHINSYVSDGYATNTVSLNCSYSIDRYTSGSRDGQLIWENYTVNDGFAVRVNFDDDPRDDRLPNERAILSTGRTYTDSSGNSDFVEMKGNNYEMDAAGNINVYKVSPNGKDYLAYSYTQNDTSSKILEYNSHGEVVNTYTSSLDESTEINEVYWS